jgi:hypothetical protein
MKWVAYFLLLCGLLNSAAWGQSARKNQPLVIVRCTALSCSASSVSRRANPEVKVGTFKSFPHSGILTTRREVKLGTFPTAHSGIRTARYELNVGTFKSFLPATSPRLVLARSSQPEKEQKTKTLVGKTDAFPLPTVIVLR